MHGLLLLLLTVHPHLPTGAPTVTARPAQDNLVTAQWRGTSDRARVLGPKGLVLSPVNVEHTQNPKFLLDLKVLSQANLSLENPNIQVTIEVDPSSQTEVELDLSDTHIDWGDAEWRSEHELFWPLFWQYDFPDVEISMTADMQIENTADYSAQYDWQDNILSGEDHDGRSSPEDNWITDKYLYEYDNWSSWSPCSATCGPTSQKRTRSCGYSCTATESRVCNFPLCPGVKDSAESSALQWTTEGQSSTPTQDSVSQDTCDQWLSCKSEFLSNYLQQVLTELPGCPCLFPSEAVYSSLVLRDENLARSFHWRDASGMLERLDIYNPGARFCLRSLLSRDSNSLGAQHCCYDHSLRLVTRGQAAGIPNLISAEFSPELHYKADVLPWILCKGDWSRIHTLRPPNNGYGCPENPSEEEYLTQLQEAQEF